MVAYMQLGHEGPHFLSANCKLIILRPDITLLDAVSLRLAQLVHETARGVFRPTMCVSQGPMSGPMSKPL